MARAELSLSARSVIEELKSFLSTRAPDSSLLRIYWYDGIRPGAVMSADQTAIADMDDIKLRLGFINGQGQQKGVDSLIVTDMIELARQRAICEAILLSGDEDVRIGVQIAQNYGVRVHLLGIHPARGSQSPTLRQEADTTSEWDKLTVEKFLTLRIERPQPVRQIEDDDAESDRSRNGENPSVSDGEAALVAVASKVVGTLQEADFQSLDIFWKENRGVPPEFDKRLLAIAVQELGRRLDRDELRSLRAQFRNQVSIIRGS